MAHPLSFNLPTEPQGIEYLIELALDLRGTWEHAADELWGQLDPELWRLTLNPWAVLQPCRMSDSRPWPPTLRSASRPRRWSASGFIVSGHAVLPRLSP
jgi:hypothetical protein